MRGIGMSNLTHQLELHVTKQLLYLSVEPGGIKRLVESASSTIRNVTQEQEELTRPITRPL
jgi:hypothetical protein